MTERNAKRVGVRDVARAAGVSTATVSRALSGAGKVSGPLASRVAEVASRLGYVPNSAARSLALMRSHRIGAVIPTIDNAIFARGIDALQQRIGDTGYSLLIATSHYSVEREWEQVRSLVHAGAEALMFMGETRLPQVYDLLANAGVPYVNTGVYSPDGPHACVGFDNVAAAERATRYLLQLGHRRIGMIAGIQADNDRAANRVIGVRRTLAAAGLTLPDAYLQERIYETGAGREAFRTVMQQPSPPTAILCGNDVLAIGAILESLHLGIAVPDRVSIIGFDDLDLATHMKPSLTTMRVPTAEMGRRAADYLLGRLAGRRMPHATEIQVSLVVRDSTGPPPPDG